MCLKISNGFGEPQIATEDLIVYKVLKSISDKFTTPYQNTVIKIGCTYTSEFSFNFFGDIEKGLHSYVSLDNARYDAMGYIIKRVICKCLIPKGSRYYQGLFGKYKSIASDKLTYLEII